MASSRWWGMLGRSALLVGAALGVPVSGATLGGADAIYFGGPIITVNDKQPSAEAVAVKAGKIVAVGTRSSVEKAQKGPHTRMLDLAGKTMLPGFFDAHSHFSQVGLQAISANLLPPPDGPVNSIAKLQQVLRDYLATSPVVKQYGVVIGFDYDDSQLAEGRSPTAQELDAVSTEIPVFITHQSGHLGVYNSKAMAVAGVSASTPNPEGGIIRRKAGSQQPDGVMEENAHFATLLKLLPKFTVAQGIELLEAAQAIYLANGFTTVQEGRPDPSTLALLSAAAKAGAFKVDLVAYPDLEMNSGNPMLSGPLMSRSYTDHFRLGGVKLTLDGSPQGKTAWFTQPYYKVPENQPATYLGYPSFTDERAQAFVTTAFQRGWQLMVHANGDAAIDQLIKSVRAGEAAVPGTDRRTVLIHGQALRQDQVGQLKALGIFPALFPMHTFYWGDWHRQSVLGPVRAENISPTGWILASGMKLSIHSDAAVTFPNSMRILDSAVNRTTRTGYVLGPSQRLEPMVALKAMTLWPAYQHFEEKTKGSIEVGKVADLVILSANPLAIDRARLVDIRVDETIKSGQSLYKLPPALPAGSAR
jgi:predicted amidohydrolase YtcJ